MSISRMEIKMTKIIRKKYDITFKKEAIALVEKENYSLGEAAIRFGVSKSTMSLWKQQFGHLKNEVNSSNSSTLSLFEQKQLQKELTNVKRERDILKKALAYFAANPQQ